MLENKEISERVLKIAFIGPTRELTKRGMNDFIMNNTEQIELIKLEI